MDWILFQKVERNEGLQLGRDLDEDEELLLEALEPPSPTGPVEIVENDLRPAGKSILVTPGFKYVWFFFWNRSVVIHIPGDPDHPEAMFFSETVNPIEMR